MEKNRRYFWSIVLSWLVAVSLYVGLVLHAGVWNILANTRILRHLISGGLIRHHDKQIGLISGLPDQMYYVRCLQPVQWFLVAVAAALFLVVWALKANQMRLIAGHCGLKRTFGQSWQAFTRGYFIERLWPFGIGDAAAAAALDPDDAELPGAYSTVFLQKLFLLLSGMFLGMLALLGIQWRIWFAQGFWALVIICVAYYWGMRPAGPENPGTLHSFWKAVADYLTRLLDHSGDLLRIFVVALLAFALKPLIAYLLLMAFNSQDVILNVSFIYIVMAICAGYLARIIHFTPGGIGQFEWGVALALKATGLGMPEAATIAILFGVLNYSVFFVVYAVSSIWAGARKPLKHILGIVISPGVDKSDFESASLPPAPLPFIHSGFLLWRRALPVLWVAISLFFLDRLARIMANYWLLESLGFTSVFWVNARMITKLFLSGFAGFALLIGLPAWLHRVSGRQRSFILQVALLTGLMAGYMLSRHYLDYLLMQGVPFGEKDPVFNRDIGFYTFFLSNLWTTVRYATWAFFLGGIVSACCALMAAPADRKKHLWSAVAVTSTVPTRIAVGAVGFLLAFNTWLNRYNLLWRDNTSSGIPSGASAIDVEGVFSTLNLTWFAALVLFATTVLLLVLLTSMYRTVTRTGTMKWTRLTRVLGLTFLILVTVDISDIGYTSAIWLRDVIFIKPNEPVIQLPYIERHVQATRNAYQISKIEEVEYIPNRGDAPLPDLDSLLAGNAFRNALLWPSFSSYLEKLLDPQHVDRVVQTGGDTLVYGPSLENFRQRQKLRAYYNFLGVDPLRFTVDGEKRMVVSSVREIPLLEPQEWLSWFGQQYVIYTHGFGLVAALSGEVTPEGDPVFVSSGIPPRTDWAALEVENPRVLYGEGSGSMALSNMRHMQALDYPTDDGWELFTIPEGESIGVKADSLLKRAVFGWLSGQFFEFMFSRLITQETRLHYLRTPLQRLGAVAPFLAYDSNVIAVPAGDSINWLTNGMTYTDLYPYSKREILGDKSVSFSPKHVKMHRVNYIEDAVKAVVDAYSGEVTFYRIANGPIIDTWANIYPGLFVDGEEMPGNIRAHLTYPLQLFHIQFDDIYAYYQMEDPMYFFSLEDLWDDADEVLGPILDSGKAINFSNEPYHILLETGGVLPESSEKVQFALKMIFTPEKALNLRAIALAYQDGDDYGRLIVLKVPKGEYILGLEQADAAIDQDPEISRLFGHWTRTGSEVIRGHTTMLMYENELIYIEPVFIRSEQNRAPQLRRVIAVVRGQPFMGETLEHALRLGWEGSAGP